MLLVCLRLSSLSVCAVPITISSSRSPIKKSGRHWAVITPNLSHNLTVSIISWSVDVVEQFAVWWKWLDEAEISNWQSSEMPSMRIQLIHCVLATVCFLFRVLRCHSDVIKPDAMNCNFSMFSLILNTIWTFYVVTNANQILHHWSMKCL